MIQKPPHNFLSWMMPSNDDAGMALSGREMRKMECLEIGAIVSNERSLRSSGECQLLIVSGMQ
jgi:hypothetical protein